MSTYVHSMTLPPPCFVLLCAEISPTPLRLKAVCLSPLFALWQRACTLHHVRLWVVYEAAGRCVQRSLFAQARRPRRTRAGYYRGATLARNELHLSPGTRVPLCLTTHTNIFSNSCAHGSCGGASIACVHQGSRSIACASRTACHRHFPSCVLSAQHAISNSVRERQPRGLWLRSW